MNLIEKAVRKIFPKFIIGKLELYKHRIGLFSQGTYPLFVAEKTLKKSAEHPDTFSKKIRYKMAFDRRQILTTFADKVAVRDYVSRLVGKEYLTTAYAVLDESDLDEFNPEILPRNFVIKANHGSGGMIVVSDQADKLASLPEKDVSEFSWERLLIHPDNFDWLFVRLVLKRWLGLNYYWTPGFLPQWAYKDIKPMILIEEFLSGTLGVPDDYRLFVFNGKCAYVQFDKPRIKKSNEGVTRDIFDCDWNRVEVITSYPNSTTAISRPKNLKKMIEIAEMLGSEIDHIRVDLYDVDGRIVFGELTNYSAAGSQKYNPESFNYEIGKSWHPEKLY